MFLHTTKECVNSIDKKLQFTVSLKKTKINARKQKEKPNTDPRRTFESVTLSGSSEQDFQN